MGSIEPRLLLLLIFGASALITIAGGVPLRRRKVKPNMFYGFRLPATLRDEELWYDVNEKLGKNMMMVGNVLAVLAAAMFGLGVPPREFTGVCVGWIFMGSLLAAGRCFLFVVQRERVKRKGGV